MRFTFVIGTLNRDKELSYCLESLLTQEYKNFEIIIIDQSDDNKTENIIKEIDNDSIIYKHVKYRGISRARNDAIKLATGDYICLTDDDAYYHKDYLKKLMEHYTGNKNMIVSGYMWDMINEREFVNYSKVPESKMLTARQVIRYCPSPAISFPRGIVDKVGFFDEEFGVGAKYGAGEETDFLLRALWNEYVVYHFNDVKADHPHKYANIAVDDIAEKRKAHSYPFGIGAMYKKQVVQGNSRKIILPLCEQALKHLIKVILKRKYAKVILQRFIEGYKDYGNM